MDLDEVLIKEVFMRPILYDIKLADYKNLKKKEFAWNEIAEKVKLNEVACKKRWKGLRDSYKRCKRTQQERVSSGNRADTTKKKWKYFDNMTFLDNVITNRITVKTLFFDDEANLSDTKDIDSPDANYIDSSDAKYIDTPDSCFSPLSEVSTILDTKEENGCEKFQEFIDVPASAISEGSVTLPKIKEEQDSTAMHFAILAKKVKEANMPPQLTNRIEAKVSKLVFEELEQFYSES